MPKITNVVRLALAGASFFAAAASTALTIPNSPLTATLYAKPMVMLVASKDHKLFYEAYNDASDVDGDGTLDIRFKPSITYSGLFDPDLCYTHNNAATNSGLFTPSGPATSGKCSSAWSGNWLNYVTTSRMDALRVALYGGHREVDSTTETILRRAYIPQDAHSWAKEYTSQAVDGYLISDYTPLSQPESGKRHFFGNLTANATTNCSTLDTCSNLPPLLSVVENTTKRVWEWASKERPVLDGSHGGTRTDRTVRVRVCTTEYHDGCKQYPNGQWKPIGLLHDYGETELMLFGLITGSYDKNMSGGILRKAVSSFKGEVDTNTGVFSGSATIVSTFDKIRIRDYNNTRTDQAYKGGWQTTSAMTEGSFSDWGNPIGEMIYEALRYFAGKAAATTAYVTSGSPKDNEVGLPSATWDDPYSSTSAAKAPTCAKANILAISDPNPSFDSDQIPGSHFNTFSGDLGSFNAKTEADTITSYESGVTGSRFIGQSDTTSDSAPTAKNVTSLGTIRGLSPEEPTKQGSYYAASAAYFGKRTDLRTGPGMTGKQNTDFFAVVLSSPLPKIEAKLPNGKVIALVPFAKSISGSGISAAKASFQPTDQIVDFYVDTIANSGPADADASVNGGRYYAKFRINFEDVEQGADHDMDAISEYEVKANADNTLTVKVTPIYEAGGIRQNMGYIISGTTSDGVYLVVQDENVDQAYYLNVPPGRSPGYCDVASPPSDCSKLPYIGGTGSLAYSEINFSAGNSTASLLKDPLWYAAKWGGFVDKNGNDRPDLQGEWDADGDGVPDTYSPVQNPTKLKERLRRNLEEIIERNTSASNLATNSTEIRANSHAYKGSYTSARWSGDVKAHRILESGVESNVTSWEASAGIPAAVDRKLFINTSEGPKSFGWAQLPAAEKSQLVDEATVNFLRGERTNEQQNGGSMRNRSTHVLGDVVHSSPYYVRDTDTIYFGANDGMLHAISASNGRELFGVTPMEVIPRLKNLASIGYSHQYFVDGDVAVTTQSQTPDKNFLYATLGRGGKGLFALDVSNPASFSASNFLWEYTPAGSTTAAADADLGFMLGRPQVARMNDGSIAVIVGNGYNSSGGKAVLYIFRLNAAGGIAQVKKIDTGVGSDNGLATPGFADTNGDGRVDVIYAGDLKGNLWKFDVSSSSPASWGVALSGNPLFVAKDASNNRQPITGGVLSLVNDVGGDVNQNKRFVYFGTGSYITSADTTSTTVQSWYGIIDENAAITNRTNLVSRNIPGGATYGGKPVRAFSPSAANDMSGKKGWYVDFTFTGDEGERIVTTPIFERAIEPTLAASSMIPVPTDPCSAGGRGYTNYVNAFTGANVNNELLDVNNDGSFADDKITVMIGGVSVSLFIGSVDLGVGIPSQPVIVGDQVIVSGSRDIASIRFKGKTVKRGRISWRELVRD